MGNIVTITFNTDAVFSRDDVADFTESVQDFVTEIDGDADRDSVVVEFLDPQDAKRKKVAEFIRTVNDSRVSAEVRFRIPGVEGDYSINLLEDDDKDEDN